MDLQDAGIPFDADKLLFAEDFVSFVMTDVFNRPYEGSWATPHRPFIHNTFNESLKVVLNDLIIRSQLYNSSFYTMVDSIREPNEHKYWEVVRDLQSRYSSENGFDAKDFLLYCIDATIAAIILKDHGLESAPDTAVSAIYEFLKDYDMLSTGWNTLNILVSYVASIHAAQADILTPESMSPWSSENGHDQDLLDSSSLQGRDSGQQSKENGEIEDEEHLNVIETNMPVSKDTFTVNTKACTENLEFSCLLKWKDLLPSDIQEAERGEIKSSKENEATYSKEDSSVIEGTEVNNLQISSISVEHKTLQSVNTFEGNPEKFGTTTASDFENKGTLISDENMDTNTCHKYLVFEEGKELGTFDEHEKLKLSEERCMLLIPKKSTVSHRLSQLPGRSSESDFQGDKGRNRSK